MVLRRRKNCSCYLSETTDNSSNLANSSRIDKSEVLEQESIPAIKLETSQVGEIPSSGAFSSTLESPTSSKPMKILRPKGNFDKNDKIIQP